MWSKTCTFQPTQLRLRRESQWIMVQSTTLHCLNEIPKGMVCSWWMFGCCEEIRPLCVCKSEATCQKKLFLQLNTAWHKKKRQTGKFSRKRKPFTRKQLCSVTPTVSIFLAESWNPTVRLIAETLPSPCVIWYFSCTGFNWRTPVEGCQKKGSTGQSDRESHSPNRLRALKFVA